jgi:endonuclease YncB( thermonuclease family)
MGIALNRVQIMSLTHPIQKGATMATFTVTSIIDGDTFDVSPQWKWNGQTGTRIRPAGYDAPELNAYGGQAAKTKLSRLIYGEQVELRSGHKVDRGRLVCEVFFKNTNLANYFPECQ